MRLCGTIRVRTSVGQAFEFSNERMIIMNVKEGGVRLGTQRLALRERLRAYYKLIRLDRPIGIFLLMWPALWALWIAGNGNPPWNIVLIFVLGVALMRSAGCAINDYADRNFDGQVARTRGRPIAAGLIGPHEAIAVFLLLSFFAFVLVVVFLNWQTVALSFVALGLAAVYPFMKRFTHLPQLFLGAAFGWAVPMAFMAVTETIPLVAWVMFIATIVWALIYDTQYAMVDREDDLKIGIKSSAILFGRYDRLFIGLLQVVFISLLVAIGVMAERGLWYYGGLMVASFMSIYQLVLIRRRNPVRCFEAFLHNNYLGMAVFVALVLDYAIA